MNPILELKNLKKNYGAKEAVKGIHLEIPPGELFVLLGPNGAGKTTTLKMAVGLLKPTAGEIRIGGIDLLKDPMGAKNLLSFVPDIPYVYEKLTPLEFLRFMGNLYSIDRKLIAKKSEELLSFFSIWDVRNLLIEEFSHGMRQKVILAGALLHDPKVFILDEPMGGLDPVSIKSFKDFLKQKAREGMTIIFSTHTLSMAEELADKLGIIFKGELVALGTMDELRQKYHSHENLEAMFMKLVNQGMANS
ncbi:MAG TPA: ABC transporter ATP-binding protein [bacterium]|nr:ABC transporter ATP-binding protein [bacterium]